MSELRKIAADTQAVYERNAARFDAARGKTLFEQPWLERFCGLLPERAPVLDVGCGSGDPISRYLIEMGYDVTGVDYAQAMVGLAAQRFPSAIWACHDMRTLALSRCFDGVIAWHSFFHLTPEEQAATLPRLVDHVAPGGALMLTVGPRAAETTGHVSGETVYHASLSEQDYRQLLAELGVTVMDFVRDDRACGGATVLLAQKQQAPT